MKIIAHLAKDSWGMRFLVELSERELQTVAGSYGYTPQIGDTLELPEHWQYLRPLIDQTEALAKIPPQLRALADLLEPFAPKIKEEIAPSLPKKQTAKPATA